MNFFISAFALAVLSLELVKAGDTSLVCGESSSSKKISIESPFAPPNLCEYKISANSKSVCQMRIDFSMTLAQPQLPTAKNGLKYPECINDALMIGNFILCGVESSQHLYVPINRTAGIDSVEILFKVAQRKGVSKLPALSWKLKVTQLECPEGIDLRRGIKAEKLWWWWGSGSDKNGYLLAPNGCDQYYPAGEGTIQSFNYNDGEGIYPYNTNYAMCFRRTTATVGLLIKAENFNLGQESNGTTIFSQTDSQCLPQLPTEGRVEDYLMIPQAQVQENEVRANYFCGQSIKGLSVLSTNPGPMTIIFKSGQVYKSGTKSQGFLLKYATVSE